MNAWLLCLPDLLTQQLAVLFGRPTDDLFIELAGLLVHRLAW
jgi:hypothetical protein